MQQDGQVLMTRQDGQVQLAEGQGRQKQSGGSTAGMPFIFSSSTEGTRTRTPTIMGTSPPPFAPPHSSLVSSSSLVALVLLSFRRAIPTLLNSLPWGSSPMIFDNHISLSFSLFIHRFYQIWSTILWTLIYSCRREKTRVVFKCHVCPCSTLAS